MILGKRVLFQRLLDTPCVQKTYIMIGRDCIGDSGGFIMLGRFYGRKRKLARKYFSVWYTIREAVRLRVYGTR